MEQHNSKDRIHLLTLNIWWSTNLKSLDHMILKPSYTFEPLYTHSHKVEIFCHIVLLGDIDYLLQFKKKILF